MRAATLFSILFASIWMYPDTAHALFEAEATFGSLYGRDWGATLIGGAVGLVVAAAIGAAVGAAVVYTGGAAISVAAPVAGTIGTMIGNFMGLTGAAATKAGLALVGGGSIAAGGLGMAGGAAIITGATSGVALDALIIAEKMLHESVKEERETDALYARLVSHSEGLITFPLPKKKSGSDAFKEAMSTLGDVDDESPLSIGTNRLLMSKAITKLRWNAEDREKALAALVHIDKEDADSSGKNHESLNEAVDILLQSAEIADMRDAALLSLFYFILDDYTKAGRYADRAVEIAQAEDPEGYAIRVTLPMFISATSSLYDQDTDYEITISRLKDSLLLEPEHKLIPLLFSIFLDRFTLRSMIDGHLNLQVFHDVFDIMRAPPLADAELRLTNYILLLGRYLIHIENEGLKIRVLSGASDDTIRNHPKTLPYVRNALDTYGLLLRGASDVESNIAVAVMSVDGLDDVKKEAIAALRGEYTRAILDREELSSLVNSIERRVAKE